MRPNSALVCAGAESELLTPQIYNGAYTDDLRSALKYIKSKIPNALLVGIGFSLGSNVLVKVRAPPCLGSLRILLRLIDVRGVLKFLLGNVENSISVKKGIKRRSWEQCQSPILLILLGTRSSLSFIVHTSALSLLSTIASQLDHAPRTHIRWKEHLFALNG